ncbi:hypothetical protein BN1708_003000, partial [Verticillium longisporum]
MAVSRGAAPSARRSRSSRDTRSQSTTTGILLSLLSAPLVVSAQGNGQCVSLQGSKMCPAFQSASVATTGFVADIFPFLPFVSSRETFDQQMGSYIRTTYVQQKFAQNFGCGNIDLRNTNELYPRFTTSVICNAIVQNSIQACNLAGDDAPPLCADTCAFYAQSEALITSDRNLCPNPSNDLISLIRADFTNCYIPPGSLSTANCVQGVANEPNNCGYGNSVMMDERADEWDARRQAQRDSGVSSTSARGRDTSPPVSGEIKAFPLLRLLREYQLPQGEHAVWCEHFKMDASSVLMLATNRSRILAIDLRTMSLLYVLENPVHHGTPTCFCIDRKRNWLCVGTSHGVLDLWDLRFKMRLKGWGVPGKSAIHRVCVHPSKGRGKWVCVAGGTGQGEVTVWDLERTTCREIYRVGGGSKEALRGYEPWQVDEDRAEGMLGRYATYIEPSGGGGSHGTADGGVRAMVAGTAVGEDTRDVRHAFIVTGSSDKKLRFWDLSRVENSTVYSGLTAEEQRPMFTASQPTAALAVKTERIPRAAPTAPNAGAGREKNGAGGGGGRSSRSTVVSVQQQQLLKAHLDSITDVAVLEMPYCMTVSADRCGVVFIFS